LTLGLITRLVATWPSSFLLDTRRWLRCCLNLTT